jgi:DNA repair photolyase
MVEISFIERKSSVLSTSSLACLSHIPSVNLTSGCAHECVYCYARGYSVYPGENKVTIYKNTLEKLKSELPRKKNKPQAVYFSPSSDIFQPVPEVLDITHSILEFLLLNDVGIAFVSKGHIPDKTMDLLLQQARNVRAQIGLITHDDIIRRIFEPNATSVEQRLEQMKIMSAGGISVESRIIPILPGITDKPDSVDLLIQSIAETGVKHAAISTLFLRPAISGAIRRHVSDKNTLNSLFSSYKDASRLSVHAENSSVIPLPKQNREAIYACFNKIARKYSISLSICGCMNTDIGGTCNITGKWMADYIQPNLFKGED